MTSRQHGLDAKRQCNLLALLLAVFLPDDNIFTVEKKGHQKQRLVGGFAGGDLCSFHFSFDTIACPVFPQPFIASKICWAQIAQHGRRGGLQLDLLRWHGSCLGGISGN